MYVCLNTVENTIYKWGFHYLVSLVSKICGFPVSG